MTEHQPTMLFRSMHLCVDAPIAKEYFPEVMHVFVHFQSDSKVLLIAPVSSETFYRVHGKAKQYILKNRNLQGDRSIALHDLFVDFDLVVDEGTPLKFEYLPKINALKIPLPM